MDIDSGELCALSRRRRRPRRGSTDRASISVEFLCAGSQESRHPGRRRDGGKRRYVSSPIRTEMAGASKEKTPGRMITFASHHKGVMARIQERSVRYFSV